MRISPRGVYEIGIFPWRKFQANSSYGNNVLTQTAKWQRLCAVTIQASSIVQPTFLRSGTCSRHRLNISLIEVGRTGCMRSRDVRGRVCRTCQVSPRNFGNLRPPEVRAPHARAFANLENESWLEFTWWARDGKGKRIVRYTA